MGNLLRSDTYIHLYTLYTFIYGRVLYTLKTSVEYSAKILAHTSKKENQFSAPRARRLRRPT